MPRQPPPKDAAYLARRAADTARWRSRDARGVKPRVIDTDDFHLECCIKFTKLKRSELGDKNKVNDALSQLFVLGLAALVEKAERLAREDPSLRFW